MEKVLDHFLYLLELNANNKFIVYSPTLSRQIPTSYAANAFNVFQRAMHQIEIVRLCALWDGADHEKENIPTVVELIDDKNIIKRLGKETRDHWAKQPVNILNLSSDPELAATEQQAATDSNIQFGDQQAATAKVELKEAIADVRAIQASPRLESVMNLRDKHLAHSFTETRREKRGPIPLMKYGDETALLNDSISIVERLFCWVNGKSFSIANSQRIDNKNAEALWTACHFTIESRDAVAP
jgi:hypothetical protein